MCLALGSRSFKRTMICAMHVSGGPSRRANHRIPQPWKGDPSLLNILKAAHTRVISCWRVAWGSFARRNASSP